MKIHVFILLFIAAFVMGCASTDTHESAVLSPEVINIVRSIPVHEVSETVFRKCPKSPLTLETRDWKVLVNYTNSCLKIDNIHSAEVLSEKLGDIHHQLPWGFYFKGVIAEKRGDYRRALWMNQEALKKGNNIGLFYYQKGRLLWNAKDYEGAVVAFEEATKKDDSLLDSHNFLGRIYLRDQDYAKALNHFNKVAQKDTFNVVALYGIAECYIEKGDAKQAIASLNRAISKETKNINLRLKKAYVLETLLGEAESALIEYQAVRVLSKKKNMRLPILSAELNAKIRGLEKTVGLKKQALAGVSKGDKGGVK